MTLPPPTSQNNHFSQAVINRVSVYFLQPRDGHILELPPQSRPTPPPPHTQTSFYLFLLIKTQQLLWFADTLNTNTTMPLLPLQDFLPLSPLPPPSPIPPHASKIQSCQRLPWLPRELIHSRTEGFFISCKLSGFVRVGRAALVVVWGAGDEGFGRAR